MIEQWPCLHKCMTCLWNLILMMPFKRRVWILNWQSLWIKYGTRRWKSLWTAPKVRGERHVWRLCPQCYPTTHVFTACYVPCLTHNYLTAVEIYRVILYYRSFHQHSIKYFWVVTSVVNVHRVIYFYSSIIYSLLVRALVVCISYCTIVIVFTLC